MASLGQLVVSLSAETSRFQQGMDRAARKADSSFSQITKLAKTAGVAIGGFLSVNFFKNQVLGAAEFADSMGKLAQRAGETTEAMSRLSYAAKLSDVSNQELAKGLRVLGAEASNGGKNLRLLGITLQDSNGTAKTSEQLFKEVADRIAGIADPAQKAAVAAKIFGDRVGPQLIPLLNGGSAALEKAGKEAEKFGQIVSEKAAREAAEFNDNLTKLTLASQGLARELAGPLVKALADVTTRFIEASASGKGFFASLERALDPLVGAGARDNIDRAKQDIEAIQQQIMMLDATGVRGADRQNRLFLLNSQLEKAKINLADLEKIQRLVNTTTASYTPPKELLGPDKKDTKTPRQTEAEKYTEQLRRQLEATDNLTVADTLLRDIQLGRLGQVSDLQQRNLLGLAQEIDQRRFMDKELDQAIAKEEELRRITERRLQDASEKAKKMAEETRQAYVQLGEQIGSSIGNNLENAIMTGMKFKDVVRAIIQDMIQLAIRKTIVNSLTGGFGSLFGSMFGGGKALGGPVKAGTSYLVGEKGPELFTPGMSGNITPNGAGGGNSVVVNVNVEGGTRVQDDKGAGALGSAIAAAVRSELLNQKRPGGLLT
jgi:hypothetical protein